MSNQQYDPNQFGTPPSNHPGPGFNADAPAKKGRGRKESRQTTRRVVSTQKRIFLVFSVIFALLVVLFMTSARPSVYIVRTTDAVGALQSITEDRIEAFAVDQSAVEPTAWSGADKAKLIDEVMAAIASKRTAMPIGARQQLRPELFSTQLEGSSPLSPDERLVSVSARASAAIVGALKAGDRVDVYAATASGLAGLLGSDIEVIAVSVMPDQLDSLSQQQVTEKGKVLSDLVPGNPIPGTYVLRVKAGDVSRFVSADAGGKIYLSLRGVDAGVTTAQATDIAASICSGASASSPACQRR